MASLLIVYVLSKGLGISPLDIYHLPASLVQDLFQLHMEAEKLQAEEIEKQTKKVK